MKHLFKCNPCGRYTMKEDCPICNKKASVPKPPKYSPEDKYASYRRQAKLEEEKKECL